MFLTIAEQLARPGLSLRLLHAGDRNTMEQVTINDDTVRPMPGRRVVPWTTEVAPSVV
jgi:hypothetical protein